MALASRSESLFIWLAPIPFLLTIVMPAGCNIVFDFSPAVRDSNILVTKVGLALSALLFLIGLCLLVKERRAKQRANRLLLALTTLLAGFPAVMFLMVLSIRWVFGFI